MPSEESSFERWVDSLFDWPVIKLELNSEVSEKPAAAEEWFELDEEVVMDYLTRMFEQPYLLAERFNGDQLNQEFWHIFACQKQLNCDIYDDSIELDKRLRLINSLSSLYAQLFAKICTNTLGHLDEQPSHPLNSACYMMWDIAVGLGRFSGPFDEIAQAKFNVLRLALRSDNEAVIESALHGLGHWVRYQPDEVREVVDEFLSLRDADIREELVTYAIAAKTKGVL